MDENAIRAFFEKDHYAKACGIEIDEVAGGKATCHFDVTPIHFNAGGFVQGGALFTLGDFAFAVAANATGRQIVSLENQITFMHATKAKKLIAKAYEISSATKVCFYQVDISDEEGRKIARMSVTGYCIS